MSGRWVRSLASLKYQYDSPVIPGWNYFCIKFAFSEVFHNDLFVCFCSHFVCRHFCVLILFILVSFLFYYCILSFLDLFHLVFFFLLFFNKLDFESCFLFEFFVKFGFVFCSVFTKRLTLTLTRWCPVLRWCCYFLSQGLKAVAQQIGLNEVCVGNALFICISSHCLLRLWVTSLCLILRGNTYRVGWRLLVLWKMCLFRSLFFLGKKTTIKQKIRLASR